MNRVLKPGGTLAVSVPSFFPEWICWMLSSAYHEMPGGHLRIFREKKLKEEIKDLGVSFQKRHRAHSLHVPYWWLKCLFWGQDKTSSLISRYHEFLVWDLMQKPRITRRMETFLDPLLGKSVAMYFCKPKNWSKTSRVLSPERFSKKQPGTLPNHNPKKAQYPGLKAGT